MTDAEQMLLKAQFSDIFRPVVTLVVYWGTGKWTGPRALLEMATWKYRDQPEELARWKDLLGKMINPYPLHLLVPAEIGEDDDFLPFSTRAGYLFWYIGHLGGHDWEKFENGAKWAQQQWHPTDLISNAARAGTAETQE